MVAAKLAAATGAAFGLLASVVMALNWPYNVMRGVLAEQSDGAIEPSLGRGFLIAAAVTLFYLSYLYVTIRTYVRSQGSTSNQTS